MVNYNDPVTIAQEFAALLKLWHVVNGIFIWEYVTTLRYELDVFRGRRPYRWTIWIYSLARFFTLMAVILDMVGFDTTTQINCQVWVTFEVFFTYTALACSAFLIVLRLIAIWNMNRIVTVIALGIWIADVSILIDGIARLRSAWSPLANTCVLVNLQISKLNIIGSLVTDLALLSIMLVGLIYSGLVRGPVSGLGRVLWNQGLIWLLIATIAEVPPSVLIYLDLNPPMNLMFQMPALVITTIAATRIYHSLVEYTPSDVTLNTPSRSEFKLRSGPFPSTDVSVHTERHQYPTTTKSVTIADSHGDYKVQELSLVDDVESGLAKRGDFDSSVATS